MKQLIFLAIFSFLGNFVFSQNNVIDSPLFGTITINKDPRLDILGRKMAEYNETIASRKVRIGKGYRLMVLSTSDRTNAMRVRSTLIQYFPDHKVYMIFQSPFIKLKFGNFVDKKEAEQMRKEILNLDLVPGNIYILPDNVEIRPEPKTDEME